VVIAVPLILKSNAPDIEFSKITPPVRANIISSYSNDYRKLNNFDEFQSAIDDLEYKSSLDDGEPITINDMLAIRIKADVRRGEMAKFLVNIMPYNIGIPNIFNIWSGLFFNFSSDYIIDPKNDYLTITIDLSEHPNIIPGMYEISYQYCSYYMFNWRLSKWHRFRFPIVKDDLEILDTPDYLNYSLPLGSVYTLENEDNTWTTVFSGRLNNSIGRGPFVRKLQLYLERDNEFVNIKNISTDLFGNFRYSHTTRGYFEKNTLAKIVFDGNLFYNPTEKVGFAGMEEKINGSRFIHDYDDDGIIEWGFDIFDYLNLLSLPETIFKMEVGQIEMLDTAYISFQQNYTDPVVVAYIQTRNGDNSKDVRAYGITSTGYTLQIHKSRKWVEGCECLQHKENVTYIVMERGKWVLPDGLKLEAGTVITDSTHVSGDSYDIGVEVPLQYYYSNSPAVLHTLNSYNNGEFKSTIVHNITTNSFYIQQENSGSGTYSVNEIIGYIAIESNKIGEIDGISYETGLENNGLADGVDNDEAPHMINFIQSFSDSPLIVVKQDSGNYIDGAWARASGITSNETHGVYAEEDDLIFDWRRRDWWNEGWCENFWEVVQNWREYLEWGERFHGNESFGYWAFQSNFTYEFKPSLAFYAEFEEYEGNTTIDSIADYQGIIYGNTSWVTEGYNGSCLSYDGYNDYVNFGNILQDTFAGRNSQFVVSAWIYPTQLTSNTSMNGIQNLFFSSGNIQLGITENGILQLYLDTDNYTGIAEFGVPYAIEKNRWNYVVVRATRAENSTGFQFDVLINDYWFVLSRNVSEPWENATTLLSGDEI